MSDLSTMIKRLLLPVIFATAAFQMPVQANTIRIIGPSADEQSVTVAERTQRTAAQGRSSATSYGPTGSSETLWSIASRNRPNNQVSVYQVIGAIHRANPQAFEQNNIHGLIPGSTLEMPTLAQIRQENVDSVRRRLEADQRRKSRQASTPASRSSAANQAAPKPKAKTPEPTVVAEPLPRPEKAKEQPVPVASAKPGNEVAQPPASQVAKGGIPAKPVALQQQLDASDEQITKLLESNHLLRVRLAEMQHEVTALKDQISSDEVLREQIKDFIQQQKVQTPPLEAPQPSWFDNLIASPLALAATALIPGSLIAGLLAFFLLRRRKEDELKSLEGPETQEPARVPPPVNTGDEATPDLPLNNDDGIDDLFGGNDESLFDDPEDSLFSAEAGLDTDEPSDSIDMLDLTSDSSDEFEIDSGLTTSSISVKGDEQAIGLQDMERALDEMEQASEPGSDEALAAMWEQSLQDDAGDEDSFDLSDDSPANDLGDELQAEQEIEDGLLDQSILDDLLSEVEAEKQAQDLQAPVFEENSLDEAASQQVNDQDELDSLFETVAMADSVEPSSEASVAADDDRAQQAAVDQALADADAMFAAEANAVAEDDIDADLEALFEQNNTALLDEFIEEEQLASDTGDIELEENSTVLLDELIEDEEELASDTGDIELEENSTVLLDELIDVEEELTSDIEVEENSTALLDELLEDDETDDSLLNPAVSIDENSTALLDELVDDLDSQEQATEDDTSALAGVASDQELNIDDVVIDESSTELLDDILSQHSNEPQHSSEPELSSPEVAVADEQDAAESGYSDPEFEPLPAAGEHPAQPAEDIASVAFEEAAAPLPPEELDETLADADFPDSGTSAFEDIFNEVLEEQSHQQDTGLAAKEPLPEVETDALREQQFQASAPELNEPVQAEEIDALLADVEGLLEEPETGDADVESIERSVDELLESIDLEQDLQQDEPQAEATAATISDEVAAPEADLPPEQPGPSDSVAAELHDDIPPQAELEETVLAGSSIDEFPTFDEEAALAESDAEPEFQLEPLNTIDAEPLDLDDLPEFDEEAAFNDPEAQVFEESPTQLSEDEEQAALDNIVKQLQQAAEAAEKPHHVEQAESAGLATGDDFAEAAGPAVDTPEVEPVSIHGDQQIEFETIDPNSLPEFSEDEALQASFDEQHELEQYELEQGLKGQPVQQAPQPSPPEPQPSVDMLDDELVDAAGLDMAALLSDPDSVAEGIPVDSEMLLADSGSMAESPVAPELEAGAGTEGGDPALQQAAEFSPQPLQEEPLADTFAEVAIDDAGTDDAAFAEPGANDVALEDASFTANPDFAVQDELDAEREQLLSGSFEDSFEADPSLSGVSGAELDMPEEDSEIWAATSPEPELETEDWAEQPQMQIEDVDAFDTDLLLAEAESQALLHGEAGSELIDEPVTPSSYISIDELMKEMEPENAAELEDEPLNLDVGLDEFPDVLSDVAAFDVDSQGEYASKLDLAKAYLEMNDTEGAVGLLEEVAGNGDAKSKREAKALLAKVGVGS